MVRVIVPVAEEDDAVVIRRVLFEVADEGGGLPPGDEEIVFEPFVTGSSPTAGTGLGLAIVRGIANAHGGESGVRNRPGRGATFWIRIPG